MPCLHLLAPRASPPRSASDGNHGRGHRRVSGADLGADAGAPDGGVPSAEGGEGGRKGRPLAGADGVERCIEAAVPSGAGSWDGRGERGGEGGGYRGELEVAGEEEEQEEGGGEHRGHVIDALRYEHRESGHPETFSEAPLAGAGRDLGGEAGRRRSVVTLLV